MDTHPLRRRADPTYLTPPAIATGSISMYGVVHSVHY